MIGNSRKAFTIFEMTVALAIFGIVVPAVMAVFVSSLRIQRRSSAAETLVDNVRFALEFMEREMRTGRRFSDELGDGSVLKFQNDRGQTVRYRLAAEALERCTVQPCPDESYANLTSPDVTVSNVKFRLAGESTVDTKQPRLTLTFQAGVRSEPDFVLRMQTTVSQRDVDIKK